MSLDVRMSSSGIKKSSIIINYRKNHPRGIRRRHEDRVKWLCSGPGGSWLPSGPNNNSILPSHNQPTLPLVHSTSKHVQYHSSSVILFKQSEEETHKFWCCYLWWQLLRATREEPSFLQATKARLLLLHKDLGSFKWT